MSELQEMTERCDAWRQLALQFDRHRMQMMALLKGVVEGKVTTEEVADFLKQPPPVQHVPELEVWCGAMPESNGKKNYTAILKRKGESLLGGFHITIYRSEYPGRTRYEADRMAYMIGEITEEPCILDYDTDAHSGYKAPQ